MRKLVYLLPAIIFAAAGLEARAARTTYPVVFAHGMGGFDDIAGYDYWGDDYGTFVGDPCDGFLEVSCNSYIDTNQKAFIGQVQPFQNSEVRGYDLANDIEGFMATVGASKVNLIGHSMGGLDIRKAAVELRNRRGTAVVRVMISVSSPHRGSPVAKYILDLGPGITDVLSALVNIYGNVVYESGNDGYAAAKQLMYNDHSATDGVLTGAKQFNEKYPISSNYANRYASIITAQTGLSLNPMLFIVRNALFNIDGNGYCIDDCDNDGAAGKGNGTATDFDDDGLVGINSQQMGYRLTYTVRGFGLFDSIGTESTTGYVSNINAPSSTQMTSTTAVVEQDHMDVIGLPPDTFDEMEFYAALIDYIAYFD
jgi:pimeloyl-ACP methyl ester carboxylesterase